MCTASHSELAMAVVVVFLFVVFCTCMQGNCKTFGHDGLEKRILIEGNYDTIISRLDALESENTKLKQEITSLQGTVSSLISQPTVAFMAYLTHDVSGQHQHIIFENVKLNLGNAYNPNHGNFLAPSKGLYVFHINACSLNPHFITLDLKVNGSKIGRVLAGDQDYSSCSSNTFYVHLNIGDDVYVTHEVAGDLLREESTLSEPSFSGALLHADSVGVSSSI